VRVLGGHPLWFRLLRHLDQLLCRQHHLYAKAHVGPVVLGQYPLCEWPELFKRVLLCRKPNRLQWPMLRLV
jgi:hypothetical protein